MKSNIQFNWEKKGIIFDGSLVPFKDFKSRTMLPKATYLKKNITRIFYSFINNQNNANCSFFDFDIKKFKISNISKNKTLKLGKPGLFDDSGTLISAITHQKNKFYLFYNGYKQTIVTPYSLNVGLATSSNAYRFNKVSLSPVLERNKNDPYFITGPYILYDNAKFHCWYTSGMEWKNFGGKFESQYCIKYATSKNCIDWNYSNKICLSKKNQAIAAPSIFKFGNMYHMVFCYRSLKNFRNGSGSYKIGYAYSKNKTDWIRNDKYLKYPEVKNDEWNSNMQCYPNIIVNGNKVLMFHNGNGFGETGISLYVSKLK
jgi:hypothetical protein